MVSIQSVIPEKFVTFIGTSGVARLEFIVPMLEIGALGWACPCNITARNRKIKRVAFFMLVVLSLLYVDNYQSINAKLRNVRLPGGVTDQTFYRVTNKRTPGCYFNIQQIDARSELSGVEFKAMNSLPER